MSVPLTSGECLKFKFKIIDGDVPMILGKDELRNLDGVEAHKQDWLEVTYNSKKIKLKTKLNEIDGHARLILSSLDMKINQLLTMIEKRQIPDSSRDMIRCIHLQTHFHPKSMELLLKRANKWDPHITNIIQEIQASCKTCRETGDPEVSKKFNLNKLHKKFNSRVYMDIAYWGNNLIIHMVDFATS